MADGCTNWGTVTASTTIGHIQIRTFLCPDHYNEAIDPRIVQDQ